MCLKLREAAPYRCLSLELCTWRSVGLAVTTTVCRQAQLMCTEALWLLGITSGVSASFSVKWEAWETWCAKLLGLVCVFKGQALYLKAQEQTVGKIMLRVWFWKSDLQTAEESNGVGQQCDKTEVERGSNKISHVWVGGLMNFSSDYLNFAPLLKDLRKALTRAAEWLYWQLQRCLRLQKCATGLSMLKAVLQMKAQDNSSDYSD